jgi:D-alanine transaminase
MHDDIVYLNGDYLPLSQAKVSVLDRGFMFGDGVYEVIPVYGGYPLRLPHHLQRLQHSLDAIRIANPLSLQQWQAIIEDIIEKHGSGDQSIYLQITRGVAPRDHAFPSDTPPTVLVMSSPLRGTDKTTLAQGFSAITLPDIRWQLCHIKAITLLPNVLFRQQALDAGADDAILIRDGKATEASASNLFIVRNQVVITPPKGSRLLPGITRDLLVELAGRHHIAFEERDIDESELVQADEIWLTSSVREIAPVITLNQQAIGDGKPGPLWSIMYDLFQDYKQVLRSGGG